MQNIQVLVLSLIVVLAVLQSCYGLKCNTCDTYLSTKDNPACLDPYTFGEDNLGDCEDDDTHCVKMKTVASRVESRVATGQQGRLSAESGGLVRKIVVSRYCISLPGRKDGCDGKVGGGAISVKCFCSTDACNSGPINKQHFTFLATTTFLSLVLTSVFLRMST